MMHSQNLVRGKQLVCAKFRADLACSGVAQYNNFQYQVGIILDFGIVNLKKILIHLY